jgi:hypothetical protein
MPTLDADENRYLLFAGPDEVAVVRRIPGHRYSAPQRCWVFPRQAGVVLALDRMFGSGGWSVVEAAAGDLEIELAEARGRVYPMPQNEAHADLDGTQLAIECSIADKELVKLVPGYRWSPAQRRWFVAALPLALDVLRERFGGLLTVSDDAETYVELRRIDEERTSQRQVAPEARPANAGQTVLLPEPGALTEAPPNEPPGHAEAASERPLWEQMARLTEAVEGLRGVIEALVPLVQGGRGMGAGAPTVAASAEVSDADAQRETRASEPAGQEVWRDLLALAGTDAAAAFDAAGRRLQTTDAGQDAEIRAVAGVAASRMGEFDQSLTHLRRVLGRDDAPGDAALRAAAEEAYLAAVLGLVTADCGPERPVATPEGFREMLLAELGQDHGFKDATIGSQQARERLEFLVNDPVLRRVSPAVSDYCRIAHLLGIGRSGTWMAAERVADVIRDSSLQDEGFAFAAILFANVLLKEKCVEDWLLSWPEIEEETLEADLRLLVTRAVGQLGSVERELAADAALSCLVSLAKAPADCATLTQRRTLVRMVPPNSPARRYAEFVAAFPLAAEGQRGVLTHFPGYIQVLQQKALSRMAPHLLDVFVQDSGGAGSLTRALAEQVILKALGAGGVTDPETQVMELLDLLAESPKADNLLNQLAGMVEDAEFPGADLFTREQRKAIYTRALTESVRAGHDHDMREGFDRLVRELRDEGARGELRTLASKYQGGPRHLRIASLVLLLEALLEDKEPFRDVLEHLVAANTGRGAADPDDPVAELTGLTEIYPEINVPLQEIITARGQEPTTVAVAPDLSGKRVVIVGGHQWLKKQALPVMTERWKMKVDWLEPQSAKNGAQALGLAGGSADLVVINTSCIGHAASGRALEEAKAAGTAVKQQPSHGVGSLLTFVRHAFEELATPPEPAKPGKAKEKGKIFR